MYLSPTTDLHSFSLLITLMAESIVLLALRRLMLICELVLRGLSRRY
jgi:hypothetical protein